MFFLGHMGIGSTLIKPWTRGLSKKAVLLGAILPDLIDKSLYYSLHFWTGKRGSELGLITGTRTFGHTAVLLMALSLLAFAKKSKWLAALSLGIASHLVLDQIESYWGRGNGKHFFDLTTSALLWPFTSFPIIPYQNYSDHLFSFFHPFVFWGELIGATLLGWDYWKTQRLPRRL